MKLIFDLDLTLINSKVAEPYRPKNWAKVYQLIPEFSEYNGIKDLLSYLNSENIEYCIVTSTPKTYCQKVCNHWGIDTKHLVCYHDVLPKEQKPNPAQIFLAIEKLNCPAIEILSFGDKHTDIIASNNAGVNSVACLWGAENKDELLASNPKHIITYPNEIIPLIKSYAIKI